MKNTVNTFTRRRALAGIAIALGNSVSGSPVHAFAQQPAEEKPCTSPNQARTSIHYDLNFKADRELLYASITDQTKFAAFTGMPATIEPTVGGAFSMFGGMIVGRNVELVANQRIVQAWRPASWGPGVYSIVHFEFKASGAGTDLVFDHTGFPSGLYDHLDWGWKNHYWEPLKKYFG
jgi:activator of HSP90 ATPase